MVRYQSQRAPDTALRGRLRDLANERRRFGYRRLFVLLRREGSLPASTASTGSTAKKG
jgi:putative transposase